MRNILTFAVTAVVALSANAQNNEPFGTFNRPFAADSLWNSRPVNPVLGTDRIGPSPALPVKFLPIIAGGEFSTKAFLSTDQDGPMIVYPPANQEGITEPDRRGSVPTVTIARWPASTVGASGGDGHADIVDHVTNRIHSFYGLKFVDGKWTARQHSWSLLQGKGWPDPSHSWQGARAVGVPSMAGIIRLHEIDDGQDHFKHALAMSLPKYALSGGNPAYSNKPAYVYPATAADSDSWLLHKGQIPEGTLMMLPADYTMKARNNPPLEKVINTLKLYGARVVDENVDTPFFIYVENDLDESGASWPIYKYDDKELKDEMELMRLALRPVIRADHYIDGNGVPTTANVPGRENLLSMRGDWKAPAGMPPLFNSQTERVEFPIQSTALNRTLLASISSTSLGPITWARPVPGATYRLTVIATGGASMWCTLQSSAGNIGSIPRLYNGQSADIVWADGASLQMNVTSGINQASSIRATLVQVSP